jgi:hypothetical protein
MTSKFDKLYKKIITEWTDDPAADYGAYSDKLHNDDMKTFMNSSPTYITNKDYDFIFKNAGNNYDCYILDNKCTSIDKNKLLKMLNNYSDNIKNKSEFIINVQDIYCRYSFGIKSEDEFSISEVEEVLIEGPIIINKSIELPGADDYLNSEFNELSKFLCEEFKKYMQLYYNSDKISDDIK